MADVVRLAFFTPVSAAAADLWRRAVRRGHNGLEALARYAIMMVNGDYDDEDDDESVWRFTTISDVKRLDIQKSRRRLRVGSL